MIKKIATPFPKKKKASYAEVKKMAFLPLSLSAFTLKQTLNVFVVVSVIFFFVEK